MLPFGLLFFLARALFVRSHRKQIEKKCMESSSHGNVAGIVNTEPHKTSSVFVFDIIFCCICSLLFQSLYKARERNSATSRNIGSRVVHFIESFFHCCIIYCANCNCSRTRDLESVNIGEEYFNQQQVLVNRKKVTSHKLMKQII